MKTKLLTAAALTIWLTVQVCLMPGAIPAADDPTQADLLFVQNAQTITADGTRLTLKGFGPSVLFFTDRPQRIAGHMTNERYLRLWKEDGKDSFLADPPNATVAVFAEGNLADMVVTLRNPRMDGDDLIYDISVIQGKLPEKGGPGSLFIDIIGMPLTPISYAGAGRRAVYRRW